MYRVGDKVKININHPAGHGECTHCVNKLYNFTERMRDLRDVYTITHIDTTGAYHLLNTPFGYEECFLLPYNEKPQFVLRGGERMKQLVIKPRKKVGTIPYRMFKLGIELETVVQEEKKEEILQMITTTKLPFEQVGDGSIETSEEPDEVDGVEFRGTKPMSYTELKKNVKKLSDIFSDNDVYINSSCGFHLHVSNKRFFNHKTMNRIVLTWSAIEDFLLATQPRSRMNNSYCKRYLLQYVQDQKLNRKLAKGKQGLIDDLRRNERYQTLNLTALAKHGTIEVRLHAGTTQYKKIIEWVNLMLAFFTYCLQDYNHNEVINLFNQKISEEKIQNIINMLGLTERQGIYFKGRVHKFLFDKLAQQQESAGKIIKNIKVIQNAHNKYVKAQRNFQVVDNAYQQEYRNLQG